LIDIPVATRSKFLALGSCKRFAAYLVQWDNQVVIFRVDKRMDNFSHFNAEVWVLEHLWLLNFEYFGLDV